MSLRGPSYLIGYQLNLTKKKIGKRKQFYESKVIHLHIVASKILKKSNNGHGNLYQKEHFLFWKENRATLRQNMTFHLHIKFHV